MPVFNRWEHTKQSLDSLFENTWVNGDINFNLWVVDDFSTPENRSKLIEYHETHRFNLILNPENIGPAASRNDVCKMITEKGRGDYLYHSDNDVYFTPNWLQKLVTAFDEVKDNVLLLGGGCHPYLQNNATLGIVGGQIGIKDAVSGYSQLMTWKTWYKYGPFDEGNRTQPEKIMGSEDWAFCQRIIKDGYKVGSLEPEVVIATGKTNTYGKPATGSETFKNVEGVFIQ